MSKGIEYGQYRKHIHTHITTIATAKPKIQPGAVAAKPGKGIILISTTNLLVYLDGTFYPASEAKISVFDHGLLYGDGIFEGICVYNGRIFRLEQHLQRLYESANTIDLKIPLTLEQFKEAILETVKRNKLREGYIRPIVTRGPGKMGLDPKNCKTPSVIIIPQTVENYPNLTLGKKTAKAIVASIRRTPSFCLPASAKTLNYLNNILAKQQAIYAGVDEAIMLDWMGFVSEGTGDNLFIVRRGFLLTPALHSSVLGGITRQVVLEVANTLGIGSDDRQLTIHDLYNADEAFFASTSLEIQPLIEIDGRTVGNGVEGPITKRIHEKFNEIKQTEGIRALD